MTGLFLFWLLILISKGCSYFGLHIFILLSSEGERPSPLIAPRDPQRSFFPREAPANVSLFLIGPNRVICIFLSWLLKPGAEAIARLRWEQFPKGKLRCCLLVGDEENGGWRGYQQFAISFSLAFRFWLFLSTFPQLLPTPNPSTHTHILNPLLLHCRQLYFTYLLNNSSY